MANPNPHQGRLAQRRRRKPGNMQALAAKLWGALEVAERLLSHPEPATQLRAVHAISQAAGSYARLYEVGELEARLNALEQADEGGEAT